MSKLQYSGLSGLLSGLSYNYTYNNLGQIASIAQGNNTADTYAYDSMGQLTSAWMVGEDLNYTYTYDTAGNLLKVQANGAYHDWNDYTNTYTYGNNSWKDLLTKFNNQAIAYEGQTYSPSTGGVSGTPVSGNPISYFNGTRWAMDWAEGRNLVEAETSTETTDTGLSFAYDASGLRTSKTVTTHTHEYAATVIQPTCTEGGYTVHTCACGDSYQDSETDPLGHNYVESEVDTYTCTRCGDSYTTHTHSYTTTVVEPTCTEDGYTLYQCVSCGYSYEDFVVDALGHDFERISMTPDEATYECTRCGYIYTEESIPIPTLPDPPVVQYGEGEEAAEASAASQQALVPTVTEEHSYIYAGGMLLRETITSGNTTRTLDFRYDNVGYPYALIYNNGSTTATYYYITNLQGDVMYLVDSNGNQVAAYTYDPYGKILSATGAMAEINPLRYRGYYYDSETGFYYLQSRYYDPNTCRFINADGYASTGQDYVGQNMFSYCNNNPTLFSDPMGYSPFESIGAWIANAVEDAREWIEDTVPVVWEKTKRVAESVWNNLDLTFGVGAGLYGQFEIADMGFEAGGYGNVLSIHLSEGEFDVGQDLYLGITGGIVREIGTSNYAFLKDGNIVYEDRWSWINSEQETIGIFSSSLYLLFAGYTFSVEFNLNEFLKDIDEIF